MRESTSVIPGAIRRIFRRRRQDALEVTGFRGIVDASLDIVEGKNYAANDGTQEAWGIDEANQIPGNNESKRPIQLLTAWRADPVRLFGEATSISMDNVNELSSRVVDEEIAWEDNRKARNWKMLAMMIVLTILALSVAIPTITNYFKSGS